MLAAAVLPLSVVAIGVAHAATRQATATDYVSTTGNDSGPCSQAEPCKTINVAITKAPTGGTISVASGTYNQTVDVTKPVTLAGQSGAVIDGEGIDSTGSDYGTVYVGDVDGLVVVKGFTIENPYPDSYTGGEPEAVSLHDTISSGEISISNDKITEGSADPGSGSDFPIGIDTFDNVARTGISNDTISGFFQGVLAEDNGPMNISGNTFSNEISNSYDSTTYPGEGLFILSDLAGSLTHQNATSNSFTGYAGYGIAVEAGYDGGNCTQSPCTGSTSGSLTSNSFNLGGSAGAAAIFLESQGTNDTLTYAVNSNAGSVASPSTGIEVDANSNGATSVTENNDNIKTTGPATTTRQAPLHAPSRHKKR